MGNKGGSRSVTPSIMRRKHPDVQIVIDRSNLENTYNILNKFDSLNSVASLRSSYNLHMKHSHHQDEKTLLTPKIASSVFLLNVPTTAAPAGVIPDSKKGQNQHTPMSLRSKASVDSVLTKNEG